jgi:hypothetical protein
VKRLYLKLNDGSGYQNLTEIPQRDEREMMLFREQSPYGCGVR